MEIIERKDSENKIDYAIRLINNKKEYDIEYTEIIEKVFDKTFASDEARKRVYGMQMLIELLEDVDKKEYSSDVKEAIIELKKLKQQISDERTEYQKLIRTKARNEDLYNIVDRLAEVFVPQVPLKNSEYIKGYLGYKMIVNLSDWHFGKVIEEFNNMVDNVEFQYRIEEYLKQIQNEIQELDIKEVYIFGLGDYIDGIIHNTIRVKNRESITGQIIGVIDNITYIINGILKLGAKVYYGDVIGNHSRIFADKGDCLDTESFDLIIRNTIEKTYESNSNFKMIENINERIGTVKIGECKYAFVHGHDFKMNNLASDLATMTREFYDAIFVGHLHHIFSDEQNCTMIYGCGTLAGSDSFSNRLCKTSRPSQTIFILNEDGKIQYQKNIFFE